MSRTEPERFDRARRTAGLFLGPVVFVAVLAAPTGLDVEAHRLAAVFALVVVLWMTEAIPLAATALLGPALAVVLGVAGAREAFRNFGHPIIFLFLGSFMVARAMMKHGLDRRIALSLLSRSWVGEHPARILFAFGAIAWFLSMWMSNTATTAMMLPIGLGVLRTLPGKSEQRSPYAVGLMLMIAFSCNVGGIATPVGTPPNLIAIGMIEDVLGRGISFVDWMVFGVPIAAGCFAVLYVVVRGLFVRGERRLAGAAERIRKERKKLGAWSPGEKAALTAFLFAVALWTLPGVLGLVLDPGDDLVEFVSAALPEGAVAILAATLLFVIPVEWRARKFALDWSDAARIDWGTILLFGGGLSLGSLAFSTGLAEALGGAALGRAGLLGIALLSLIAVFVANIMTELMSNTATANLLVPMFLALAVAPGSDPVLPAIAATLGCSLAFCLPVATPPNAIVYGSGRVPLTAMIRGGILLDVLCGLLTWACLMLLREWLPV